MASERKRQKLEEESDEQNKKKPSALFLLPDVILEVEGIKLYVRKQVLADNSPVFKRMLESDFKEKHQIEIPLPEKKCEDVEIFLRTFYHPDILCPISSKWVFFIKRKCLIFISTKIVKHPHRVHTSETEAVKE